MHVSARRAIEDLKADSRSGIVFFTGAGASKTFGYPLTNELLPRMLDWANDKDFLAVSRSKKELEIGQKKRDQLKQLLRRLLPGINSATESPPLITNLLSVLDQAIRDRQPLWPTRSLPGMRALRTILDQAIFDTLEEDKVLSAKGARSLKHFANLLASLRKENSEMRFGVITSNYDLSTDWAVLGAALPESERKQWDPAAAIDENSDHWDLPQIAKDVDFGAEWLDPFAFPAERAFRRPTGPALCCYKLHGSTTWLRCPVCQRIYINPYGSIWFQAFRAERDEENTCHCAPIKLEPQIVSPSFVREMDDLTLRNVWHHSQTLLRSSKHWVIAGYGLPDEDVAIRSLLIRALHCHSSDPMVTVVQRSKDAYPRYEALFGRKRLRYVSGGFGTFLGKWR